MVRIRGLRVAVAVTRSIERAGLCALLSAALPSADVFGAPIDLARPLRGGRGASVVVADIDALSRGEIGAWLDSLAEQHAGVVALTDAPTRDAARIMHGPGPRALVARTDEATDLISAVVAVAAGRRWTSASVRERIASERFAPRPVLSRQESRVMRSYGEGAAVRDVAVDLGIAEHTVRTYVKRIRAKYALVGVELESRVDFYRHLDDHDVALRTTRDRVRTVAEHAGEGVGEPVAS
jgi:two-component system, NarL family, nitrate/nitrite response regulator NarL